MARLIGNPVLHHTNDYLCKEFFMTHTEYELVALIGNVIFGKPLPQDFAVEDLRKLTVLALNQDVGHIVYKGLDANGLITDRSDPATEKLYALYMKALYRLTVLENEIKRIRAVLDGHGIDYMLLKGAVLRGFYPEPWMRISADIDLLVRSVETAEDVCRILAEELLYKQVNGEADHDRTVLAPGGFHVEIHFSLGTRGCKAMSVLGTVWEKHAVRESEQGSGYRTDDDFFYYYHIYHAARHFSNGGCGIKTLLDETVLGAPRETSPALREMLSETGLTVFRDTISELARRWFGSYDTPLDVDRSDDLVEQTGLYILEGGMFGGGHYIKAVVARKGNRFVYFFQRLFPSVAELEPFYPSLKKTRLTLPFCWIHRFFAKGIAKGEIKNGLRKDVRERVSDTETIKDIRSLFDKLELR